MDFIANALCASWDWLGRFEEAHPTASVVCLWAFATVCFTIAGTLE